MVAAFAVRCAVFARLVWQAVQAAGACLPVSANLVVVWSNGAFAKLCSLWQLLQSCLNAPLCGSTWQAAQVSYFGVTCSAGRTWHSTQATVLCLPSSANFVVAWSNFRVRHVATVWQLVQASAAFGVCGSLWHEVQVAKAMPLNCWFLWHDSQATFSCAPSSLNAAFE